MASVTLDPRLLAPPEASASAEAFRAFVTRLLGWSAFSKEKGCSVTISRYAQERLLEDEAYPLATSLQEHLRAKGIREYDLATLKVFCEGFFRLQPCFQEYTSVTDILQDDAAFLPDIQSSAKLPKTSIEAVNNLVTLALLHHSECRVAVGSFVLQSSVAAPSVSVSANIHDIEHTRTDLTNLGKLPQKIKGDVTVCSSLEEFAINCDEGSLLLNAPDDDKLCLSIRLAIFRNRLQRSLNPDWEDLPYIRLGADFRSRAQAVGVLKSGWPSNIMESIVGAYEGTNERLTHALRTGPGGDDPQIKSGEFGAWRRDISKDVHLHYWKGTHGLIELSWISHPHNDFYIPRPSGR